MWPRVVLVVGVLCAGCVDVSLPPALKTISVDASPEPGTIDAAATDPQSISTAEAGVPDAPGLEVSDAAGPEAPPSPADTMAPVTGTLPLGRRCGGPGDCESGACVDGVCCAAACTALCYACNIPGFEGTCQPVPSGQDQSGECAQDAVGTCGRDGACDGSGSCRQYVDGTVCQPGSCTGGLEQSPRTCDGRGVCRPGTSRSCAPNSCAGSSCGTVCAGSGDCQAGFVCESGACRNKRPMGAVCNSAEQCSSGYCVDGTCCGSPCSERCHACNVTGSLGSCTPVPDGTDPGNDCPTEAASTCGRAGACNGKGACRLHPAGTTCSQPECVGGKELEPGTCNGSGVCSAGVAKECGNYACAGATCATTCTSAVQCAPGLVCVAGACQMTVAAAPATLHWRLDEETGTTATDASGNGLQGTYTGTSGTPLPSATVPTTMFPNPRSRAFTMNNRHAIQLSPMPAALKPANNLTISVWFSATKVDSSGAELLSGGNQYLLRITDSAIRFSRRTGSTTSFPCETPVSGHLDGKWHLLVGVQTPQGMKLYLDGVERCTNTRGDDIRYSGITDLWVGRHTESAAYDFEGQLDDVRIYTRALTAEEVMRLYQGHD